MTQMNISEIEKNVLTLLSLKNQVEGKELEEQLGINKLEQQLKSIIELKLIEVKKSLFKKTITLTEEGKTYLGNSVPNIFITKDRILMKNHDTVQAEVKIKNLGKTIIKGEVVITEDSYLKVFHPQIKEEKGIKKINLEPMLPGENITLKLIFSSIPPENIDRTKNIFTVTIYDDKKNKLDTKEEFFYIEGKAS